MEKGKKLEKECQSLFKLKGIFSHRFYDTKSAGNFLPSQPSDFLLLTPKPVLIECKETEKNLLPISNFRPSQLKAMRDMFNLRISYYIVVLNKQKNYYLLDSKDILTAISKNDKSIDISGLCAKSSIEELFKNILYK